MAMFRAVCNLVDNTISNALIRWGGLNPNLAVVNYPSFINQPVQVNCKLKNYSPQGITHEIKSFQPTVIKLVSL